MVVCSISSSRWEGALWAVTYAGASPGGVHVLERTVPEPADVGPADSATMVQGSEASWRYEGCDDFDDVTTWCGLSEIAHPPTPSPAPDEVRDTPTLSTPPLQPPGPAAAGDTPEVVAARDSFVEQARLVKELFAGAYGYLRGTHGDRDGRRAIVDLAKGCVEVGVRESRQDEHSALRYPAGVDPRPILAKEARLVRENKARDWRPAEETRKASLLQRLDFDFYKSIRDKYVLPRNLAQVSLAQLSHEVGALWVAWARHFGSSPQAAPEGAHSSALASEAVGGADGAAAAEVIKRISQKLDFVEAYIRMEIKKKGGAASPAAVVADAKRKRGGLKGFRSGHAAQPTVGFDGATKRAKPLCPRCPSGAYHGWLQCPLGGLKPENAGTAAAYCAPAELSPDEQHSLLFCFVFQQAAEDGAAAFAGVAERYGAPAVLHGDRGPAGGIDLSAYGFAVERQGASDDSDGSDDEALDEINEHKQQVEDVRGCETWGVIHACLVGTAARGRAAYAAAVSLPHAKAPDHVVPEPQGPWMHGPDGLAYTTLADDHSHVAPGEPTPAGMHCLGITPEDTSESEENDDKELEEYLAAERTAYASGNVVAAAPAVGGRACGVGQSAFASYMPKWLLVSTLLICVTAVGALQASSGFQPGGAYPPAGFHTKWGMPLERTRERLVAGGASHFPNPPYDSPPPPPPGDLADYLTVTLEPNILAAYRQGFLAALRLRDSPQAVPGTGGTAAGDALRMVVPPPGGEIYELTAENDVPEDEDEDAAVDAEAALEHFEI
ncbi:hypothetical protein CYMTET_55758 [Cymbomonas tetramitiformis]|uniref:Uncharacterized protein n=1 Tax=Cymbomonas tetramitiformis TaxID=36881 RepID=A0AAE0EN21_9CHLO|nr:hypothetical protein CYMTET_55758 [Cymbomonas tetramitiformis]